MTTIVLTPPCAFINSNDRLHHHAKAKLTRAWRDLAMEETWDQVGQPSYARARIVIAFRFPTNHRREVSNLHPTAKAIVDGLVDAGVLPDDDDGHIIGPDLRRDRPNGPPRVTITIREHQP